MNFTSKNHYRKMTDVGNLHAKRKLVVGDAGFLTRDPPNQSRSLVLGGFRRKRMRRSFTLNCYDSHKNTQSCMPIAGVHT